MVSALLPVLGVSPTVTLWEHELPAPILKGIRIPAVQLVRQFGMTVATGHQSNQQAL